MNPTGAGRTISLSLLPLILLAAACSAPHVVEGSDRGPETVLSGRIPKGPAWELVAWLAGGELCAHLRVQGYGSAGRSCGPILREPYLASGTVSGTKDWAIAWGKALPRVRRIHVERDGGGVWRTAVDFSADFPVGFWGRAIGMNYTRSARAVDARGRRLARFRTGLVSYR